MKVVIQDTSILVDLAQLNLLDQWFGLGIETLTTTLVWREVNRRAQKARLRAYADDRRIQVVPMPAEEFSEVIRLRLDLPETLSVADASVLRLAQTTGAALLTGDRLLRQCAEERRVEVHGILWVLQHFVDRRVLEPGAAAEKLETLAEMNPRLPRDLILGKVKDWRGLA